MTILSKDGMLAWRTPVMELANVSELGGRWPLRRMSGDGLDAWDLFRSAHTDPETGRLKSDTRQYRATLVALCSCDEQGRSLEFSPEEVVALGEIDGVVLDRLFDVCCALNSLHGKSLEDLKKNSSPDPSSDSGTS